MEGMVIVYVTFEVIANVFCESDSANNDRSFVHGIAAKIGFPPTILKVFIKGDVQPEVIEKLLNIYTREDKVPNESELTRNRRNSITDYIGKLYSYNNLFRPYRGFKQSQTTKTPWLKKFMRGVQEEPKTESFWGMALGAHTFSPIARPLAQTRMPYHRIRNQQRIDKLLGITRNYGHVLAMHPETKPYWIKNQEKLDQILAQAKGDEITSTGDQNLSATTRKAFHRAPLDVAGLKNFTLFPRLHGITTPRRLKFCEKQCADESEEGRTKRPASTETPRPSSAGEQEISSASQETTKAEQKATVDTTMAEQKATADTTKVAQKDTADECTTTEESICTICDINDEETEGDCKSKRLRNRVSAVTKNVRQTILTSVKLTTSRYTRSKEHKPTGPVWTLPPNSVLDQMKTTEEQRRPLPATKATPENRTESGSTTEYTTTTVLQPQRSSSSEAPTTTRRTDATSKVTGKSRSTSKHGSATKQMLCIPMPIPTRIRIPNCTKTRRSTKRPTRKSTTTTTTTALTTEENCTPFPDLCDCTSTKPPSEEKPTSVGNLLVDDEKPSESNKAKPQKIVVRISSALGEVPVVIMRDNGVSGVSLSLVSDYLLDENNRLIKYLGKKPMRGSMNMNPRNSSAKPAPHASSYKNRHCFPHLLRHQLHSLQPKRYSFRVNNKPSHRLVSGPRMSLRNSNPIGIAFPALSHGEYSGPEISNPLPSYKLNSPDLKMNRLASFSLQYPAMQNPSYQSFKMEPVGARIAAVGQPIPQMELEGFRMTDISRTEFPRFKIHPGIATGGMSVPGFEPSSLNLQPAFPQQLPETSQLLGYRPPFLPLYYQNKNGAQPQKGILGGLQ